MFKPPFASISYESPCIVKTNMNHMSMDNMNMDNMNMDNMYIDNINIYRDGL